MPSLRSRLTEGSTLPQWALTICFGKGRGNPRVVSGTPFKGLWPQEGAIQQCISLPVGRLGSREELFLGAALLEARAQWERSADTLLKTRCGGSFSPL